MEFNILTIFPHIFSSFLNESIIKKAIEAKKIKVNIVDFRKFAEGKHKSVDDKPYGGGPGMVLKVEPIYKALKSIKKKKKSKIILLTPRGREFNQKLSSNLSRHDQLTLICGRYEGFDERISQFVDLKISVGKYILMGGEIPAMAVIESVSRLIPGVVHKKESLKEETFSPHPDYFEYPQYTRPLNFKGLKVPPVLISGNHRQIREWRAKKTKIKK